MINALNNPAGRFIEIVKNNLSTNTLGWVVIAFNNSFC